MPQSASATLLLKYETLFESLKLVVSSSEQRVISDEPDPLFIDNVNFFVKSYLISVCSYLEAYLQDIAFRYSQTLSSRVTAAKIPHNFLHWRLNTGIKDKQLSYSHIALPVTKKDISDVISANPYRTLKLFQSLGVDLSKNEKFESRKDLINTIVTKRNNIVHHNDEAADISFGDIRIYIGVIVPYMAAIKESVEEQIV
ncbi:HEPN domain-containing protein [Rheinheimera sp. 1928-s]|uniref:HEPN domain-containing protein n=1 Tax=Rheinheimera sp. 1928-s TaxID=3033803 RepID=UPI00260AAC08|nr:HEPN domain-containing protein [Rheinheimera sp. 1928-s]MDF3124746.1 HEPN domain-containing protein [Rheinheimera sp. 1928-s]